MSRLQSFSIEVNKDNQGYNCYRCNSYNDILTRHCKNCSANRPAVLNLSAELTKVRRGIFEVLEYLTMDRLELHNKFYNSSKPLYKTMDIATRRSWRDEMTEILINARASLSAADDVDREERNELSPKGREWLVTNDETLTSSDALNAPKIRRERMSKLDKLAEQMKSLGLDPEDIKSAVNVVEKTAKESNVNKITFKSDKETTTDISELCRIERHSECNGRFHNGKSNECKCECHKVNAEVETPKPAVFDPSRWRKIIKGD